MEPSVTPDEAAEPGPVVGTGEPVPTESAEPAPVESTPVVTDTPEPVVTDEPQPVVTEAVSLVDVHAELVELNDTTHVLLVAVVLVGIVLVLAAGVALARGVRR